MKNTQQKPYRQILLYIAIGFIGSILGYGLVYLSIAFHRWELHPGCWPPESRTSIIVWGLFLSVLLNFGLFFIKDKYENRK